jgi:hypothetical protein
VLTLPRVPLTPQTAPEADGELLKTPQPTPRAFKIHYQDAGAVSRSWGDPGT